MAPRCDRWLANLTARLAPWSLLVALVALPVQIVLLPDQDALPAWRCFFSAFMFSLMLGYWLIAGLIAVDRPWPRRWAFRVYLSSRMTPGAVMLLATLPLLPWLPVPFGHALIALSWLAAPVLVASHPVPRHVPGGIPRQRVTGGLDALRIAFVIALLVWWVMMAVVSLRPAIQDRGRISDAAPAASDRPCG